MLIENENWAEVGDSDLYHAAKGGALGAAAELRKRELLQAVGGKANAAKLAARRLQR